MDTFFGDLRYAFRLLARSPGFALVAVVTIALGIGANSAIFSVVEAVLLYPLPYPEPGRLVFLHEGNQQLPDMSISYPDLRDWEQQNTVFESIGALSSAGGSITGGSEPQYVFGLAVSHDFFKTLRVSPALGRDFTAQDDQPSGQSVIMLSYKLWQQRFAGDAGIIGRPLTFNQTVYTIIGVLPREFYIPQEDPQVFIPMGLTANAGNMAQRGNHPGICAIGRLRRGITLQQAQVQMNTIAARLAQQYPDSNSGIGVRVRSLYEFVVGDIRPALLVLFAAVGFVLLIACANTANLLLARASVRQQEMAIRMALGAGKARLLRQMLTESTLLAVAAGGLGLLLAYWGAPALAAMAPEYMPREGLIRVNGNVVLFTVAVSLLTGFIFGLVPALQAARKVGINTLRERRVAGAGARHTRLRGALVLVEVAISLLLLVGAGLLIRSFMHLRSVDPGFNPRNLLTAEVRLPIAKYAKNEQVQSFAEESVKRLSVAPGIESAAITMPLPLVGEGWQNDYRVEDYPLPAKGEFPNTDVQYVTPAYLQAMQIPLLRGRQFTDADRDEKAPVVIVNATFARRWWPNQDAIGKRIRIGGYSDQQQSEQQNPWATVVGVAGDVKQYGLDKVCKTEVYIPHFQHPIQRMDLVVRTHTPNPLALTDEVRRIVLGIDPDQPIYSARTMEQIMDGSMSSRSMAMWLLSGFAALALVLAAIGIYGVMSYSVAQRTHEIGIRMALGARAVDVLHIVVSQALRVTTLGVLAGIAAAFALTRLMSSLLFGVGATDFVTHLGVALVLGAVALVASLVPARRATRVDPMVALRYE